MRAKLVKLGQNSNSPVDKSKPVGMGVLSAG